MLSWNLAKVSYPEACPTRFHVFSRYILQMWVAPSIRLWCIRSLCASRLVVKVEMIQCVILLGRKLSLKQEKNISMETNFGIHHKLHETKGRPPRKQLADLYALEAFCGDFCNNEKHQQTNAKQCLQMRKTKTINRFRKLMKQLLRMLLFFGYDFVLMTFSAWKIVEKTHLVLDGLAYPASSAGLCRICETRRGGEQFSAGQWQLSKLKTVVMYAVDI